MDEIEELDSLRIQKLLRLELTENLGEEVFVLNLRGKVIFKKEYQLVDVK